MSVSSEDVRRLADLARFELSEKELPVYTAQINQTLDYAQELSKLDIENVEPMYTPLDGGTPLRPDTAQDFARRDILLGNAPEISGTSYVVPRIL